MNTQTIINCLISLSAGIVIGYRVNEYLWHLRARAIIWHVMEHIEQAQVEQEPYEEEVTHQSL